ncbi:BCCT family transporter [Flavobacterium agrisoli]|uniref:BCCT family transporter n=1 Tax=Flavobacterium agrisoli TaxID=2793066 RepID=A0A934PPD0_9FLAO|nr:BCCT family transporter [Flavobacterium agrisoli]MBK0370138.1 BCCT family transporter [Flavobacterium agrisoli]
MPNETKISKYLVINPPVFITTLVLIVLSLVLCLIYIDQVDEWFAALQYQITSNFGWFLICTVNFILFFCLYLAFSSYGKIKLGGEEAEPEFSNLSWFAMLFSAGMGIGIMFYSVAEPVSHFANPPRETATPYLQAAQAMNFTSLHWGLHAWSIYAIVGLALAFFAYNRNLPMTFRSLFYPFFGEKIHGWLGHSIDILSALATIFGLATSLGFGVTQISSGLHFLLGWEITSLYQSLIILIVISIATISVFSGLDKGVKILSSANMFIAFGLMLLVLFLGPTLFIFKSFIQNTGDYLASFIEISTWNDAFQDKGWQNAWTIFYWAWWIAWSPFVGSFIARISKGRTLKEFILGVLIIPSLITLLWMNVFGGSALHEILNGNTTIIEAVNTDISTALFVFFEDFPFTNVISTVAVILVFSFFITSSDSGSLVIDNITSGNAIDSPVWQRVFWSYSQGIIAVILLWGGSLNALQTAVIITGIPFAVIILIMCYSLKKGLDDELKKLNKKQKLKQEKSYKDIISELIDDQQS